MRIYFIGCGEMGMWVCGDDISVRKDLQISTLEHGGQQDNHGHQAAGTTYIANETTKDISMFIYWYGRYFAFSIMLI